MSGSWWNYTIIAEDIPRHEMKIAFFGRGFKKGKLFYILHESE